jgi:4-amino-4-deoxy-L-arabinose transferase-like glycosyltransferase
MQLVSIIKRLSGVSTPGTLFTARVAARQPISSPRQALFFLIVVSTLFRLGWAAAIEPTNDEAYHYLYTTHTALSYFDHPPMTMWVAKAGILLCGGWVHPLSLRLGFTLLFAASTWIMYRWTSRSYGEWAGVYAAMFLNLSAYFLLAGGFALPDSSFLFFALLTMWSLGEAIAEPKRIVPWLWVGVGFGAGLLSKYHAVFLPAGAVLYALVTPGARRILWSPGPYIAVAIGFLCFAPVLLWNHANGWASFVFQGGRAVASGFHPEGLLAVYLGPALLLFPWVWFYLTRMFIDRASRFRSIEPVERLAVCLAVVPLLFFSMIGCSRWILLHWTLIAFVPLYPLLGAAWANWANIAPNWSRRKIGDMVALTLVVAVAGIAQARYGLVHFPGKDPMTDMSGWESVGRELEARGFTAEPHTFMFTPDWYNSGQVAFAIRERVPVLCYNAGDARGFAFWSRPEQWLGWNGLLITTADSPANLSYYSLFFERVEPAGEFAMTRSGNPFRTMRVYRCVNQRHPFPFTYEKH